MTFPRFHVETGGKRFNMISVFRKRLLLQRYHVGNIILSSTALSPARALLGGKSAHTRAAAEKSIAWRRRSFNSKVHLFPFSCFVISFWIRREGRWKEEREIPRLPSSILVLASTHGRMGGAGI